MPQSKNRPGDGPGRRSSGSSGRRVPRGASRDPADIVGVGLDIDTEVAALLSDDPALALGPLPAGLVGADGEPLQLPVVLFEPRRGLGVTQADDSRQELQAETIIQAGFTRWRPVAAFNQLDDWTVRQTRTGLELWDHGGIWARGPARPTLGWLAAAARLGVVLAVYGVQLGVRAPTPKFSGQPGRWTPAARAAELRRARNSGIVAAALIPWQPEEAPEDVVAYPGPTYDPATGRFEMGVGADGAATLWQLNTPGVGVDNGLILGGPGTGKTNTLRVLNAEAVQTGRFRIWPADPTGRHDLPSVWAPIADRLATTPADTLALLAAADQLITERLNPSRPATAGPGRYTDPTPERPGILLTIDDAAAVLAGDRDATTLAERVATRGGPAGVGLVVTSRGADPAYFGGSTRLRAALAATNRYAFGPNGLDLLATLTT